MHVYTLNYKYKEWLLNSWTAAKKPVEASNHFRDTLYTSHPDTVSTWLQQLNTATVMSLYEHGTELSNVQSTKNITTYIKRFPVYVKKFKKSDLPKASFE